MVPFNNNDIMIFGGERSIGYKNFGKVISLSIYYISNGSFSSNIQFLIMTESISVSC
jgi:hypothetical protein